MREIPQLSEGHHDLWVARWLRQRKEGATGGLKPVILERNCVNMLKGPGHSGHFENTFIYVVYILPSQ